MEIRQAKSDDIEKITRLFYETIQTINSRDYPQDEIDDWSSWHTDHDEWNARILEQYFIVATLDNKIVGFASLATDGYLDLMFVHKDYQRKGIANQLLLELEKKAIEQNNQEIYSEVSITAKAFFEKQGFCVKQKQLKKSRNKELENYCMTKEMITIQYAEQTDYLWLKEQDKWISDTVVQQKIENKEVYIVQKGGKIIGWLRYNLFWDNVPFMNMIYFLDEYRQKGIGTKLVKYWEEEMKQKGYNSVLTSTQSNEGAQHFYRKMGYKEIGGFKYFDDPYEIIFHKVF
jgi:putative acetyltransferase